MFTPYSITSNIYTSYNGGKTYSLDSLGGMITAENAYGFTALTQTTTEESLSAYWKNDYTYTASQNDGYSLAYIEYDDETSSSSSYTFSSVTSDHTFYAYYVANSYSVSFNGNGSTSGSTSSMTSLYYDTTYTLNSNGFVRTGYTFTGWNTKANGTGTSYTDKQSFKNLTTTNGGTVTLYAQWEADEASIYVYYIDYYTNKTLDSYSYTGVYGEDVTTSSKDLDGYTLIKSPDTESYTLGTEDTYVYYYYAKNSDVIVYYLNYYTDKEISSSVTIEGYEGLSYTTEEKEIDGFVYLTSTSNTSGAMEDETIYVYYYYEELVDLSITKIGQSTDTPLEGVVFKLYKQICTHDHTEDLIDIDGFDTSCWELVGTYTSDENGVITLSNLPITGIYRLVEISTVDGYVLPAGQWQIEFNYDDNLDENSIIEVDGTEMQIISINNPPALSLIDDTLYLYNTKYYSIPTTGGSITEIYYAVGFVMVLFGTTFIIFKKKK